MTILLDDLPFNSALFPFGTVRSIAHIRMGILTLFEKWQFYFPGRVFIASEKLIHEPEMASCVIFPGNFVPSAGYLKALADKQEKIAVTPDCKILEHPWQIFEYNDWAIRQDFEMVTAGRHSQKISASNNAVGAENIFVEAGANISFSILNAEAGPIYIGKNADIQEGCLLRGPISVGEGSR